MQCSALRMLATCLLGSHAPPAGASPAPQPAPKDRVRVAVLGGGAAGIAAAFRLTDPNLPGHYDVTVFQPGWRVGGKCASGRHPDDGRIQEHGLHILLGSYHHVFYTLRACFAEWQRPAKSPWSKWQDLFTECHDVALMERDSDIDRSRWDRWMINFDPLKRPGLPGDPMPNHPDRPQIPDVCELLNPFARMLWDYAQTNPPAPAQDPLAAGLGAGADLAGAAINAAAEAARMLANSAVEAAAAAASAFGIEINTQFIRLTDLLSKPSLESYQEAQQIVGGIDQNVRRMYGGSSVDAIWCPLEGTLRQAERRAFILLNLGLSALSGAIRDVCLPGNSLDSLDALEFRSWLRSCGACDISLESAAMRVLYDLMFAYIDGDAGTSADDPARIQNGSVAAGVALRFVIETVVGFRQSPLWKMNAGMGDVVFTPLYRVLQQRHVDVKLFHRVRNVALSADQQRVARIEVDQQADIVGGGTYDPFERLTFRAPDGTPVELDCWPAQPRWDQLVNGGRLKDKKVDFESTADNTSVRHLQLDVDKDFDVVVLAVPPEVAKSIAKELAQSSHAWNTALRASRSVVTKAFQLWLTRSVNTIGGSAGEVTSGFAPAFASVAEMSHLLVGENWPAPKPTGLAYGCGTVVRHESGGRRRADDPKDWTDTHLGELWRQAALGGPGAPALIKERYDRTNDDPSELYVQTPPGTVSQRLSPDELYFGNLFVAGDWTRTRFSGGCVESAVESGMRAADAVRVMFPVVAQAAPD